MSHRFKQLKPLGKNKRNMKNKDAGLLKPLLTGQGSAETALYDFLYIDRERISSLYAQLFPQGTLTSVKTTAQHGSSDDQSLGSDLKVIKGETKATDTESTGIEHTFDASWAIPIEVLARLNGLRLVRPSLGGAQLGTIAQLDGFLRIIDYAAVKDMWEPIMTMIVGQDKPGLREIVELLKSIPHTMHAHFLTDNGFLWASLEPENLLLPPADIVLKHGGTVGGSWKILFILDAYPSRDSTPELRSWDAGQATDGVMNAIHELRKQIGRPFGWYGVTPLMVYREIPPYSTQGNLDLSPTTPAADSA
jgi:hypothetical protein